ncbi:hypothetical protein C5473_10765 [Leptospira interrogans serovar Weerasinghe]|nr:hypothetical protein C5473_10765 [Leptospira interrogans serovar Weerasinghe]
MNLFQKLEYRTSFKNGQQFQIEHKFLSTSVFLQNYYLIFGTIFIHPSNNSKNIFIRTLYHSERISTNLRFSHSIHSHIEGSWI